MILHSKCEGVWKLTIGITVGLVVTDCVAELQVRTRNILAAGRVKVVVFRLFDRKLRGVKLLSHSFAINN